ncbi:hypothetical protein B5M09_010682 [Aphanomyces astaci]|uniref:Uncharacterized protein n=1 Tax=Aphanomyces astaci TaxID=112090 RepID=A0A425D1N1_APHAT|nr:hypothetical protein B5M09_010682 [Aphanomyces astaci]
MRRKGHLEYIRARHQRTKPQWRHSAACGSVGRRRRGRDVAAGVQRGKRQRDQLDGVYTSACVRSTQPCAWSRHPIDPGRRKHTCRYCPG